jgi:hypothetical protein
MLFSNGSRITARLRGRRHRVQSCLRARMALDGVSWVRSGLIEIAVSRRIDRMLQNRRHHPLPPRASLPVGELVSVSSPGRG